MTVYPSESWEAQQYNKSIWIYSRACDWWFKWALSSHNKLEKRRERDRDRSVVWQDWRREKIKPFGIQPCFAYSFAFLCLSRTKQSCMPWGQSLESVSPVLVCYSTGTRDLHHCDCNHNKRKKKGEREKQRLCWALKVN